jgi:hypothetical protein
MYIYVYVYIFYYHNQLKNDLSVLLLTIIKQLAKI